MRILGISAFYHDSAAALVVNGDIVAAAQEERFTRIKHDPSFPHHAAAYCLREGGLTLRDLDAVVFYDKPFLKFERLLETYFGYAPRGWRSFIGSMPIWVKEKVFFRALMGREMKLLGVFDKSRTKLLFTEHHLSHAASAFYPSSFEEAAVLTIDGVGEWATASVMHGRGNSLRLLREMHFPHSLGLLYSAFTYYLGFKVNSGEYKLMGLAPYGNPADEQTKIFAEKIRTKLCFVYDDGSLWLNQDYFNYATGTTMTNDARWKALFGLDRRNAGDELQQPHCNLALAIQQLTEEVVLKMAKHAQQITGSKNICLAGGVALNCVANGTLLRSGLFDDIFIQPAAGDAGGALGAALAAHHITFGNKRTIVKPDAMKHAHLGPVISNVDVSKLLTKYNAGAEWFESDEQLCREVAQLIADGKVVGWCRGRMEWGPRALGNRSILGDARNSEMQQRMNLKIKFRESFRPFAPLVPAGKAADYFKLNQASPYMLLTAPVKESLRQPLPADYATQTVLQKLRVPRSSIPAVTHIDFSARVQTVTAESNPMLHKLLEAFEQLTGTAVLINTSFNVRGEPIVCTAEDAYRCFMRTGMDALVLNNFLLLKEEQPPWPEGSEWKEEFTLD